MSEHVFERARTTNVEEQTICSDHVTFRRSRKEPSSTGSNIATSSFLPLFVPTERRQLLYFRSFTSTCLLLEPTGLRHNVHKEKIVDYADPKGVSCMDQASIFSLACSAQTADYERVSVLRLTRHVLLRLQMVRRVCD